MRLKIHSDGFEGYAKRSLERAKKLSQGKKIKPELSITFDDPLKMATAITPERIRVCYSVRQKPLSVSELATKLRRDRKAVSRDVTVLEDLGLVKTHLQSNPGHGRVRIVEAAAKKFDLRVAF
jgi:predicted transcriptional regulator